MPNATPSARYDMPWKAALTHAFRDFISFFPKGHREGAASLLERQIVRRFGTITKMARRKLASASLEQLEAWSDALPEAKSLHELLK